jgi:hypothetical protein
MRKNAALTREYPAVVVVPLAQFIHQMLEAGGKTRNGPEALLQPFAHGIANRSTCLVIDFGELVCDSAIHHEF